MRPPIRPFITAHKHRSPKSRASKPLHNGHAENAAPSPALDDPNIFATSPTEQDAAYAAALQAADAIFSRKAGDRPELTPPSKPSMGRVLPDLLQQEALASLAATAAMKRTRRAPQSPKVANPVLIKPKKVATRTPPASPATPRKQQAPERELETAPEPSRRTLSAIQRKWVFKTEFKAGEKWKRRLRKVARLQVFSLI